MKKRYKIDKSQLAIGIPQRIRDEQYLKSYKEETCVASDDGVAECGSPAIAAHIRCGQEGGTGLKPPDDLTHALCDRHHKEQHNMSEETFIVEKIYKPSLRRKYREWKGIGRV